MVIDSKSSMTYNWDKFVRKAYIKAPLEDVFNGWVTKKGIESWFIKKAIYKTPDDRIKGPEEHHQAGDKYYWKWHQDLEITGVVLQTDKNKLVEYTFGKKSKDSDEDVRVKVEFSYNKEMGETEFILTQSNMGGSLKEQAHYHLSCNMGWSFFIANMKSVFEYGNDLRELDAKRAYETRAVSL